MKIIQTFWSCGNDDLLTAPSGWYAPEYHIMGWALSCLQLKKYHDHVTLYADSNTAKLLIDILKLPYSNVVCNLDKLNTYHKNLWALPKIYTYLQQEEPFLHVDGDVFIWQPFSKELLNSNLIAQNEEVSTTYSEKALTLMMQRFSFFPDEIKEERKKEKKIYAYNAGILGGKDIGFFKEYATKSIDFVNKNLSYLKGLNVHDFNIIFEQYLFYALVKKQKINVNVLFEGMYYDRGYKEFAEFINVPYERHYLHLMGGFKKNAEICIQMSKRLRADYPEFYYKIIQLFKHKNLKLKKDFYHFLPKAALKNIRSHYANLKKTNTSPINYVNKRPAKSEHWRTNYVDLFIRYIGKGFVNKLKAAEMMEDVQKLEMYTDSILVEKFKLISNDALYKRDLLTDGCNEKIFSNKLNIDKTTLVATQLLETCTVKFDWTLLEENKSPYRKLFRKILNSEDDSNRIAIVPECHEEGYSLFHLGAIDLLILELLQKPCSIKNLKKEIANFFDTEEIKNSYSKFESLIHYRLKMHLLYNMVEPVSLI